MRALSFTRSQVKSADTLRALLNALACPLAVILSMSVAATCHAQDTREGSISDYRISAAANTEDRPNPLRRAKSNANVTQAAYNAATEQPAYQRSPIDYFEAGSPARQYPPNAKYASSAAYSSVPTENFPSPNQSPNVFQQRGGSFPTSESQLPRNMPSPAGEFAEQNAPQNGENCSPDYSGAPNQQGQLHALPGSGIPQDYQTPHYPRAIGFGEPLMGTSWQNRPFHVDIFSGSMIGDDAVDNQVGQEAGFFIGTRVGWDYDYYWGVETRLGLAWMSLFDRQSPESNIGTGNIVVWDMSLLYYPWGDSRWRPFLLLGAGIQQLDSYGNSPAVYSGTLAELPFGLGMKYRMNEWMVFRFDVIDNLAFGTGSLDTMHNVSLTAGLEYHFGGKRRSYWPWNPNPKH